MKHIDDHPHDVNQALSWSSTHTVFPNISSSSSTTTNHFRSDHNFNWPSSSSNNRFRINNRFKASLAAAAHLASEQPSYFASTARSIFWIVHKLPKYKKRSIPYHFQHRRNRQSRPEVMSKRSLQDHALPRAHVLLDIIFNIGSSACMAILWRRMVESWAF